MSKWIKIPEDVEVEIDVDRSSVPPKVERRTFGFVRYFVAYLLDEPETFGKTREGIFAAADIEKLFENKAPSQWVKFSDSLFMKLKTSHEKRDYQNGITIWRKLVSFMRAIDDATSDDPLKTIAASNGDAPKTHALEE